MVDAMVGAMVGEPRPLRNVSPRTDNRFPYNDLDSSGQTES